MLYATEPVFCLSQTMAASSHVKSASAETCSDSCRVQGHNEIDTLYLSFFIDHYKIDTLCLFCIDHDRIDTLYLSFCFGNDKIDTLYLLLY